MIVEDEDMIRKGAVAQIVDDNDLFAGLMECVNDMSADVAAAAGDENCHS